ncbi:MAG: hypothetical protein JO069_17735 [Verrucomicrobia bacterium]|nr:hypothetical protein [Verrucomicrobiota bacterium]
MIAFRNSLPLVRLANGEVSALSRDWLRLSLGRAAQQAGYVSWWLAEHVAESVLWYLASGHDRPMITKEEITESVRAALQATGYSEIAARFETLDPPFELSLADLALEAGPGYELAFFHLLRERIRPALHDRASNLYIHGLQPCVRHLQSVKTWSRECSRLRNEIVTFVRAQLASAQLPSNLVLTIR